MRLKIDGMEVEIKVKGQYAKRFNKEDTMYFLNNVSLYASLAYAYYEERGHEASASRADEFSNDIYAHLKEIGCYDN